MSTTAILALADGTVFHGTSIGAAGLRAGEIVFNTAMGGFQEVLTDPACSRQIVSFTYPHIGNIGCTPLDDESNSVHAAGLVVREIPTPASNWRSEMDMCEWLITRDVVAIAEIDTRKLTHILRERGTQSACLMGGTAADAATALAAARAYRSHDGLDLVTDVTCAAPAEWTQASAQSEVQTSATRFHVVVLDFGVRRSDLRTLVDHGCRVTLLPANSSVSQVLALQPDGVFFSDGPGDPRGCDWATAMTRELLAKDIPCFGNGLGHQLLALAAGAQIVRLPHGHHGGNHPVRDLISRRVEIVSQRLNFAVDAASLPPNLRATHSSLFDDSNQGFEAGDAPVFAFQGHLAANNGPLRRFVQAMGGAQGGQVA